MNDQNIAYLNQNQTAPKKPNLPTKDEAKSANPILQLAKPISLNTPFKQINYVCRDLALSPCGVTLVCGVGFSGKSLFCQALALSVASGQPFLGRYSVAQARTLHLDYEQGSETQVRYRRLAFGMGLKGDSIQGLHTVQFPPIQLDDPDAERILGEALLGYGLCIIDSFRAAIQSDENDSRARCSLDMLGKVGSATQCCILVIHHAGKGSAPKDARFSSW